MAKTRSPVRTLRSENGTDDALSDASVAALRKFRTAFEAFDEEGSGCALPLGYYEGSGGEVGER